MATLQVHDVPALSVGTASMQALHPLLQSELLPPGPFILYAVPVSAGFPSPADGSIETSIDLNRHCIRNPLSTYFARISGHGWGDLGVAEGDELVIDRGLSPIDGSLVLADIDGVRSLFRTTLHGRSKEGIELHDGFNNRYGSESGFVIWGVVTFIIRSLR